MEYQRVYTDLRSAQMSFTEFMEFISQIYNLGVEKGAVTVTSDDTPACFAAAPLGEQYDYRARQ